MSDQFEPADVRVDALYLSGIPACRSQFFKQQEEAVVETHEVQYMERANLPRAADELDSSKDVK